MKVSTILLILSLIVMIATNASGGKKNDEVVFKGTHISLIERNLAIALRTPIPGMQASASQAVRDLKGLFPDEGFTSLVIPLMAIVKNEHADASVRAVAALALHDLESGRGDFAIQQMARFTENRRMAHLCAWLTVERMRKDSPEPQNTAMR